MYKQYLLLRLLNITGYRSHSMHRLSSWFLYTLIIGHGKSTRWWSWPLHTLVVIMISPHFGCHGMSTQRWTSWPLHFLVVIMATLHKDGHHGHITQRWTSWPLHSLVVIMATPLFVVIVTTSCFNGHHGFFTY